MSDRIDWTLWRSFLQVAECGSLSGAARRLSLTQPTVGRHIDQLEEAVGRKLFLRSPHGLTPTEEALALLPEARAMSLSAESLERVASASAEEVSGIVRIAASHVVGTEVLPEALAPLLEALPRLEIEVVLSNSNADLLRHEADLAIRMVRPTQGSLVARRVGKALIGLFARRDYLERHGTPVAVTDLPAHILIGSDRDPTFLAGIEQLGGPLTRRDFRLRCDSEVAQIAALRQGLGIAFCQAGVASRDLNLVPVLREQIRFALDCWLVTHEDLRLLQRVRLVADHLARDLPKLFDRRSSAEQ